ncbi:hypothetical protein BgiBS90_037216, partial [Biomphalaria glabrata]
ANQVNECNRRDPRKLMDPDIVQVCDQLNGNKYQIYSKYTGTYYKNIFCSICDLMAYPFELVNKKERCIVASNSRQMILYEMLLNIQDVEKKLLDTNPNDTDKTTWSAPNVSTSF